MLVDISKKPSFQPVTLTLVIETREELIDLLIRLNAPAAQLNENNSRYKGEAGQGGFQLWNLLDDIANELGLIND